MDALCGLGASHPVLVAAGAPSPTQHQHMQSQTQGILDVNPWYGGSGFVWNEGSMARECVVVTSATWLASLLRLRPSHSKPDSSPSSVPTGVEWELTNTETVFHVVSENTQDHTYTLTTNHHIQPRPTVHDHVLPNSKQTNHDTWSKNALAVFEAEISSVHVLHNVYHCLTQQVHSLGQWRCEIEGRTAGGKRENGREKNSEGGDLVSIELLLLPLSCVVFLKVKGLSKQATCPPRCLPSYNPQVGDKFVSFSTPFGSFCPEIFHNTMTSGCVCKSIGQNSGLFLTDTCHLPGTEGAGLRIKGTLSAEVVAMVLAPLFTEKGHPAGLSLATSLSLLPPHTLPLSLPPPRTPAVSLLPLISAPPLQRPPQSDQAARRLKGVCGLVVAVATSCTWGTGILLARDKVLTCAHVVKPLTDSVSIYLPWSDSGLPHTGLVLEWNDDMDLAIVGLRQSIKDSHILEPLWDQFNKRIVQPHFIKPPPWEHLVPKDYQGGPVYAIGHEVPPWNPCGPLQPLVTQGVLCKVVSDKCSGDGVMLMTNALVLSGMSGGVLVSGEDARMLGMIVSNSVDVEMDHTYSNVNYSLSLPWLLPSILPYIETGDSQSLHQFMKDNGKRVKHLWSLSTELLVLPSSKL